MINRINLILQAKNITARQFAEEIGIQPSGMSHILGGRNNPSLDFVAKVLRRYPEIDANWLLLGRGEMYASGAPAPLPPASPDPQPDVFAADAPVHDEFQAHLGDSALEIVDNIDNEYVEEGQPMPSVEAPAPSPRRVTKLLFVYSDGTFEECLPLR